MPDTTPHSRARARDIVLFSLAATTTSGIIALALYLATGLGFIVPFIVLRWCVIALLVAAPIVSRVFPALRIPAVLRTPITVLVLTCESIVVDIVGAQLH